jgi:hydrogenase maturation protease
MARVVVAGYGNPLRGDDGVGWYVAQAVAHHWGERVCVLMGQQPAPEWAPQLAAADFAFLVDATREVGPDFRVRPLRPASEEWLLDGHTFGPAHLLAMAGALYGHVPETYLLLLAANNLEFGEELSPVTASAAKRAVRFLDRRLKAIELRHVDVDARQDQLRTAGF